ncbi:MAG: hypothetical protein V3R94_09000 [Acidobacteriota bacterium]
MRRFILVAVLFLSFPGFVLGQGRATLSSPVLKTEPDAITFTTRFSTFVDGNDYRIGVGTSGDELTGAQFELSQGGSALSKELFSFSQGFAKAYFDLDEIQVQGFFFPSAELPSAGEELVLKVVVPRSEAEKAKRLFIIVTKQFGPDTWYIMDGAEINDTHW